MLYPVQSVRGTHLVVGRVHRKRLDMAVNTQYGGRLVYWNEPDGHVWEILTVSYARRQDAAM